MHALDASDMKSAYELIFNESLAIHGDTLELHVHEPHP